MFHGRARKPDALITLSTRRSTRPTTRHGDSTPSEPAIADLPVLRRTDGTPEAGPAGAPEVSSEPSTRNGPPATRSVGGSARRTRCRERHRNRTGNAWPVAPRETRYRRSVCLPKEPTRGRRDSKDGAGVSPRCPTPSHGRPDRRVATPSGFPQTLAGFVTVSTSKPASPHRSGASPVPFRRDAPKSLPPAPDQVPGSPEFALREVRPCPTP